MPALVAMPRKGSASPLASYCLDICLKRSAVAVWFCEKAEGASPGRAARAPSMAKGICARCIMGRLSHGVLSGGPGFGLLDSSLEFAMLGEVLCDFTIIGGQAHCSLKSRFGEGVGVERQLSGSA